MAPPSTTPENDREDPFVRTAQKLADRVGKHPAAAKAIGAAVLVALVGLGAATLWGDRRAHTEGLALAQAFVLKEGALAHEAPSEGDKKPPKDDDGDDDDAQDDDGDDDEAAGAARLPELPQFADAQARDRAAYEAFRRLAAAPRGPLAAVAVLEATDRLDALGRAPTAAPTADERAALKKLMHAQLSRLEAQDSLLPMVALRLAQYHEDDHEAPAALEALGRVLDSHSTFLGDEVQLTRARLLRAQGDMAGARSALEHVQMNFPGTARAEALRLELAALDEAPQPALAHDSAPNAAQG